MEVRGQLQALVAVPLAKNSVENQLSRVGWPPKARSSVSPPTENSIRFHSVQFSVVWHLLGYEWLIEAFVDCFMVPYTTTTKEYTRI
jgi:hypothetical protein